MASDSRPDGWGLGSFSATNAVAASGGVAASAAAPTVGQSMVTGIQYSSDAACLVTIESPIGTVIWRKRHAAAVANSENFGNSPLPAVAKATVQVKVSASTSNAEANIQGYTRE